MFFKDNIIKQKNGVSLIALILSATLSTAILLGGTIFTKSIMANSVSSKEKLQATELAYNQWLIYEGKPYDAVESDNLDKDANAADNKFAVVTTVGAEEVVDTEGSSKKKHIKIEVYKTNDTDKGQVLAYTLEADKVRPYLNNYYSKGEINSKFTSLNNDMDSRINKANGILALNIPSVPSWTEPVIPAWRNIPDYPKRECPFGYTSLNTDSKFSLRYSAWSDGDLDYTMLEDGEVYFTNSSRAVRTLTVNGVSPGWNVQACGEVVCSSTSPTYRAKKGDRIHLHYYDGSWTIHVKYDSNICRQGADYVLNNSIGQTPIGVAYQVPELRVCDTGEFDNTYRFVRIPADGYMAFFGGRTNSSGRIYHLNPNTGVWRDEGWAGSVGLGGGTQTYVGSGNPAGWSGQSFNSTPYKYRVKKGEYYVTHAQGGTYVIWKI